jgi:dipeptidase
MYRSLTRKKFSVVLFAAFFAVVLFCSAALASTAFEEGLAFGQDYSAEIRANIDFMKDKAESRGNSYDEALRAARRSEQLYRELIPSKVEWMKGVSEGAGIPYEDILIFNTVDRSYAGYEGECTTFCANGSVLESGKGTIIAKNRDLGPDTLSEVAVVQPSNYLEDEVYRAAYIDIPQVEHSYKFVGSRSAGRWGYGMGVNEHQVIVSDNDAPTRDMLAFTDGLHDNDYVRIILERAKTAREGVEVLTSITEEYGQAWNCIIFEIGDPEELWLVAVTGKRWVAKKYNDTITARSNQLQITDDYDMAAEDLISFAEEQGWVEKGKDRINFRKVYGTYELYPSDNKDFAKRPAIETLYNTEMRYQRAMELMEPEKGDLEPKDFVPMMRDHYDKVTLPSGKVVDTHQRPFYSSGLGDLKEWVGEWPEKDMTEHPLFIRSICHHGMGGVTASAAILVARPDVPDDLGLMLHCFREPCLSTYVPFYVGINRVPSEYTKPQACGKFLQITKTALGSHELYYDAVREAFDPYEEELWDELPAIEEEFMAMIERGNVALAKAWLTEYVNDKGLKALDLADQALENMVEAAAESSAWNR